MIQSQVWLTLVVGCRGTIVREPLIDADFTVNEKSVYSP